MFSFKTLPSWIVLFFGFAILIANPLSVSAESPFNKSSFYDWGSYYEGGQKVLGFSVYAFSPLPPINLPEGVSVPKAGFLLPDSPFYFTKTIFENVGTTLTFDPVARERRHVDLLGVRLAETYELASQGKADEAARAAVRVAEQTERVNEGLLDLESQGRDIAPLAQEIKEAAVNFNIIAQAQAQQLPPAGAEAARTVLAKSQDLVDAASEAAGEPALTPELEDSLQQLKSQGLMPPEFVDKIYALETRSQVRGELEKLASEGLFPPAEMVTLDTAIKNIYPETYGTIYERAKLFELRSYEYLPRPSEEEARRVDEFVRTFSEGDPIPQDVKSNLYFTRLDDLASNLNFTLLAEGTADELRTFYAHGIGLNTTAPPPTLPEEPAAPAPESTAPPTGEPAASPSPSPSPEPGQAAAQTAALAADYIGDYSGFLPGSPFYFVKTVGENFSKLTTFDPARDRLLEMQFAQERLREAVALSSGGKEDLAVDTLKRYTEQIGDVAEKVGKLDPDLPQTRVVATLLEEEAARHNIVLEKGIVAVPDSSKAELVDAIVATQDALDSAANAEGRPAIPAVMVDRLYDLEAVGILLPEEVARISQLSDRDEVRQEFRELEEKGILPPADSKKLDWGQRELFPEEFNKLVEVRKIEELSRLRQVQNDIGQTGTLRATADNIARQIEELERSIDPAAIKEIGVVTNSEIAGKIQEITGEEGAGAGTGVGGVVPAYTFALPGSPFYFIKGIGEGLAQATAFGFEASERVRLEQAQERLSEAQGLLAAGQEDAFKAAIERYQDEMKTVVDNLAKRDEDAAAKAVGELVSTEAARDSLVLDRFSAEISDHALGTVAQAVSLTKVAVDTAADAQGEPAIDPAVVETIRALPDEMVPADKKEEILAIDSRAEARGAIGALVSGGILRQEDYQFLDKPFVEFDPSEAGRVQQLQSVAEIIRLEEARAQLIEKADQNEDVSKKLLEFTSTFKPGDPVPPEIRSYVSLTRIDELTNTIRPDVVSLLDFANRRDVVLAVATLQEEFRPTRDDFTRVERFRRDRPNQPLPADLARVEALSYSLGVRERATACFLPSPPFAPNTPCPAPGTAITIAPTVVYGDAWRTTNQTYGSGPRPTEAGQCPAGYHWMYDSGGWCMADGGNYSSENRYYGLGIPLPLGPPVRVSDIFYRPGETGPGAGPYSPYVAPGGGSTYGTGPRPTAEGQCPDGYHWMYDSGGWCMSNGVAYTGPATATGPGPDTVGDYWGGGNWGTWTGGGQYGGGQYGGGQYGGGQYGGYNPSPPYYWGTPGTGYNTTTPPGTSYGGGPAPISPGNCPAGYHWMYDSGGWCMADGGTYVPGGGGAGGTGGIVGPGGYPISCGYGSYWNGSSCVSSTYGGGGYTGPGGACGGGSYWNGSSCSPSGGSNYNPPPSSGCGPGYYWNGSSCVISWSSPYSGTSGSGTTPGGACGPGYYWSGGGCVPSYSGGSTGSTSGWGSCPSGSHWMSDNGGYCMSDGGGGWTGTSTSTSTTSSPSPSTSSGSCPSGYHWMSDGGGYCMSDGGGGTSTSTSTTSSPAPSSSPTTETSSSPAPAPSSSPEPAPSSSPTP